MPVYEYQCIDCGARFPLLQSMSAAREGYRCPECSGTRTRRAFSTFASISSDSFSAGGSCAPRGGECCQPAGSPFR